MDFKFDYSKEKGEILREARGLDFDDIIEAINKGSLLDDIKHFNQKKYPNQRIFIVKIKSMVYAVPYVKDMTRGVVFLKTFYPNRKLKKKYLK